MDARWKDKIAYEIYPKSFQDTNGDGIGDIPGIISRLDYLKSLSVDILWICPVYESPFVDQGYDISDYYRIAACFGTMEDFERLICEAKKRDMYVIMDLVINHCSSEHPWFRAACLNPQGEAGERFYIRRGVDGNSPSNYRSYFGGNMWERLEGHENLYYYHSFAKEQPDLNWTNPKLRKELYDMINFWLDKGVAGFRVDAIINIKKDLDFPSFSPDGPDGLVCVETVLAEAQYAGGESIGQMLQDMRKHTFLPHGAFTVGEVFNMREEELAEYIGEEGHFSTIFDFGLHLATNCENGWHVAHKVDFEQLRRCVLEGQEKTAHIGFLSNVMENHDEPRSVEVYLPDWMDKQAGAKLLGTIQVMEHGIPFLYQGQELGMTNLPFESLEDFEDINTLDQYQQAISHGFTPKEALAMCQTFSRDNARSPMQWSDEEHGGFTTGKPWIRVNPNYTEINVKRQDTQADSVLNYYRKLLALRKNPKYRDALVDGAFIPADAYMDGGENKALAFYRQGEEHRILVISNWGKETLVLPLSESDLVARVLLDSMDCAEAFSEREIRLRSGQVLVLELEKNCERLCT